MFDVEGPRVLTVLSDEVDMFDEGGPGDVTALSNMVDSFDGGPGEWLWDLVFFWMGPNVQLDLEQCPHDLVSIVTLWFFHYTEIVLQRKTSDISKWIPIFNSAM